MTVAQFVPMQPADPLQQHVDRSQIGQQQIGVAIDADLQSLRAHQQAKALRLCGALAELQVHLPIQCLPILERVPAMVHRRHTRQPEQGLVAGAEHLFDGLLRRDRLPHRVAQHQHTSPFARGRDRPLCDQRGFSHRRHQINLDALAPARTAAWTHALQRGNARVRRLGKRQRRLR